MIKLIIFDLDGVLVDAKDIHFNTLNLALSEINDKFIIDWKDHINIYDGLKTFEKLKILTEKKGLKVEYYEKIWEKKQELTINEFNSIKKNEELFNTVLKLKNEGFKLACCSNSIKNTIVSALTNLEIINFFDLIYSNEDVKNSKPHPEIYWKAMIELGVLPEETLIIEDSPHGLLSAARSSANILRVKNSSSTTYNNIKCKIQKSDKIMNKWVDNELNILIPMAGAGSRFEKAGFTFPKPLIEVNNKPMIQLVVENLNIEANYIFIVQKSHREK